MEVTINYNGQAVAVEVTLEVYEFLDRADHKTENLSHEQRLSLIHIRALGQNAFLFCRSLQGENDPLGFVCHFKCCRRLCSVLGGV